MVIWGRIYMSTNDMCLTE